jgi:Zn-dependent peptidase ImmA (M78 family)
MGRPREAVSVQSSLPDTEEAAAGLLDAAGRVGPPVADLRQLAALRGAVRVTEDPLLRSQGLSYRSAEGAVIKLSATLPEPRKRFTLAHEIGHLYFQRDDQHDPAHRAPAPQGPTRTEEGWCQNFAGDLLMPPAWLRVELEDVDDPSIERLQALAQRYEVSIEALVHQLARRRLWPTPIFFSKRRHGGLRVRRVFSLGLVRSTGLKVGTTVPAASGASRASTDPGALYVDPEDWLTIRCFKRQPPTVSPPVFESRRIEDDVVTLIHLWPSAQATARLAAARALTRSRFLFYV